MASAVVPRGGVAALPTSAQQHASLRFLNEVAAGEAAARTRANVLRERYRDLWAEGTEAVRAYHQHMETEALRRGGGDSGVRVGSDVSARLLADAAMRGRVRLPMDAVPHGGVIEATLRSSSRAAHMSATVADAIRTSARPPTAATPTRGMPATRALPPTVVSAVRRPAASGAVAAVTRAAAAPVPAPALTRAPAADDAWLRDLGIADAVPAATTASALPTTTAPAARAAVAVEHEDGYLAAALRWSAADHEMETRRRAAARACRASAPVTQHPRPHRGRWPAAARLCW